MSDLVHNNKKDFNLSAVRNTRILFLYGFGLVLLLGIFQLYITFMEPGKWIAWLAASIYLFFVFLSYRKSPVFFWFFFLFFFGQGTAIISCAYLESGNYISEQATYAYATGATLRLVMYNLLFFLSGLIFFHLIKKNNLAVDTDSIKPVSAGFRKYLYWAIVVLLIILYAGLFKYGAPLFMGLDRFDYWLGHPMPILRTLGGQIYFLVFLLGIVFSGKKDKIIIILFLFICAYLILNSEKFSGLSTLFYLFLLPIIINGLVQGKRQFSLKRIGVYAAVLGVFFFSLVYYHYSKINIMPGDSATEILVNRALGLQGHVWWGTDLEVMKREGGVDFEQLSRELASFMSYNSENEDVGMKYLISLVAPPSIAKIYLEHGINFTMGYPAIGLYIFDYFGLIFLQVVVAGIVVLAVVYLFNKITRYQLIRAALAVKIFIEVYASFTVGNFYQLFSLKMLLYVLAALVIETIVLLRKRRLYLQRSA